MFKVNNRNPRAKLWNVFKVNNKDAAIVNFEHISHFWSSVSIVNFEQVNAGWEINDFWSISDYCFSASNGNNILWISSVRNNPDATFTFTKSFLEKCCCLLEPYYTVLRQFSLIVPTFHVITTTVWFLCAFTIVLVCMHLRSI